MTTFFNFSGRKYMIVSKNNELLELVDVYDESIIFRNNGDEFLRGEKYQLYPRSFWEYVSQEYGVDTPYLLD
jgi:hypothetical protein|nr:MAG TPA: hypothetical protein [Caudoviricetes sp.]